VFRGENLCPYQEKLGSLRQRTKFYDSITAILYLVNFVTLPGYLPFSCTASLHGGVMLVALRWESPPHFPNPPSLRRVIGWGVEEEWGATYSQGHLLCLQLITL